jgi:hypothetical protein
MRVLGFCSRFFKNAGRSPKRIFPLAAPFLAMLLSAVLFLTLQSSFRAGSLEEFSRRVFYALMAFVVIAEFREEWTGSDDSCVGWWRRSP